MPVCCFQFTIVWCTLCPQPLSSCMSDHGLLQPPVGSTSSCGGTPAHAANDAVTSTSPPLIFFSSAPLLSNRPPLFPSSPARTRNRVRPSRSGLHAHLNKHPNINRSRLNAARTRCRPRLDNAENIMKQCREIHPTSGGRYYHPSEVAVLPGFSTTGRVCACFTIHPCPVPQHMLCRHISLPPVKS
jgi:hypothetical protein